MGWDLSRRHLVSGAIAGLAGLAGAQVLRPVPKKRGLRVCFFSDAHVPGKFTHERLPDDRLQHQRRVRIAFDAANRHQPDLFLFGGDNVFSISQQNSEKNARTQIDSWRAVLKEKVAVPKLHVIGNHDIWYPPGEAPKNQKEMAVEGFEMPNRYFRQSVGDWDFYLLDVFHPGHPSEIDGEQWTWLDAELAKSNRPSCLVTHASIFSVSTQIGSRAIGGVDKLRAMFRRRQVVRLAFSGHNHIVDRCDLDEVTYICGGAVSGAWWEGNYAHFPPAFVIADLQTDGSLDHYPVYWETHPKEKPFIGEA